MTGKRYPYQDSLLAILLRERIAALASVKTQRDIATEAGFPNANYLSMLKKGENKLALDRVQALAKALDVDPARLFRLAFLQLGNESENDGLEKIFGTPVSQNEVLWLKAIREASDNSDPPLGKRARAMLRAIFGK